MSSSVAYQEHISSQIPALQLLINMGWTYLAPAEALRLRDGRQKNVVLTGILDPWLRAHNDIQYKGETHFFSDTNIGHALNKLTEEPFQSLGAVNERVYELLTLGTSLTQTIRGDRKSYSLRYIDWYNPANNVYHVTEEFAVERTGRHDTRRPDIVCFVNGIPLVIIECKRPDKDYQGEAATAEAVSQMIRNQGADHISQLFAYTQLLMALSRNDALYGTAGTIPKFWSIWREEDIAPKALETAPLETVVHALINRPLSGGDQDILYNWRSYSHNIRRHFDQLGQRLPTEQDRFLYSLMRPERLLELIYKFIVYDGGIKKIARYQQYFAVKETINRVAHRNTQGTRTGGVIWHTTGTGKSITMVMLAKALALHPNIANPKVVLVTDRVNLDDQLYETFDACGKSVVQANSGKHLVRLVTGKLGKKEKRADVITTIINKFEQAAARKVRDEGVNIFILVDESHRSQYGLMHAKMQRVFPNACYIGFTGTPLTKAEKSTAVKFGSFIHKYPMRRAVEDKIVVPLLYEGRVVEQNVDKEQLERWFERTTRHLTPEQTADLKRKMSRRDAVTATEQRIREIAYNAAEHYKANWRGTGFKAQLAAPSKRIAAHYLRCLLDDDINAALIISPPDSREGHDEVGGQVPEVQAFWSRMMAQYRTEEDYNRQILDSFSRADGIEIIVVVDKLLTGFDEPRNAVLYIDKPLREHTLLQAISRVNRLAEHKDFGYIVDYRGVLGQLNEAINVYDALAEFDQEDIEGTFTDIAEEIALLPQRHSDLWAVFEGVANKRDIESLERWLEPADRRQLFYDRLTAFASTLRIALSAVEFYEDTPESQIDAYRRDLKFFHELRHAVQVRYAEIIRYGDYEEKIRKLMDTHVRATGVTTITELIDIFDVEKFDAEVAKLDNPVAKADTILNRMKRTIAERMDEDPVLYRRFSEMVEETIRAYHEGRLTELEYLEQTRGHLDDLRSGRTDGHGPSGRLARYQHAPAYFNTLQESLDSYDINRDQLVELAIQQEQIIQDHAITDWTTNLDIQNQISRELDEAFYQLEQATGKIIEAETLNLLIKRTIEIAKARQKGT